MGCRIRDGEELSLVRSGACLGNTLRSRAGDHTSPKRKRGSGLTSLTLWASMRGVSPGVEPCHGGATHQTANLCSKLNCASLPQRRGCAGARLFQQPDLESHWVPMRNRAIPSVMAFVAQATHPTGALSRDRQAVGPAPHQPGFLITFPLKGSGD